eukprot:7387996-Prymnesium_polylepis.1
MVGGACRKESNFFATDVMKYMSAAAVPVSLSCAVRCTTASDQTVGVAAAATRTSKICPELRPLTVAALALKARLKASYHAAAPCSRSCHPHTRAQQSRAVNRLRERNRPRGLSPQGMRDLRHKQAAGGEGHGGSELQADGGPRRSARRARRRQQVRLRRRQARRRARGGSAQVGPSARPAGAEGARALAHAESILGGGPEIVELNGRRVARHRPEGRLARDGDLHLVHRVGVVGAAVPGDGHAHGADGAGKRLRGAILALRDRWGECAYQRAQQQQRAVAHRAFGPSVCVFRPLRRKDRCRGREHYIQRWQRGPTTIDGRWPMMSPEAVSGRYARPLI